MSRMVRLPSERLRTPGRYRHRKLSPKLTATSPATTRLFLAGGMMMAKNIPYSATLRALTARSGRALPARMPRAVPQAQAGAASRMAP